MHSLSTKNPLPFHDMTRTRPPVRSHLHPLLLLLEPEPRAGAGAQARVRGLSGVVWTSGGAVFFSTQLARRLRAAPTTRHQSFSHAVAKTFVAGLLAAVDAQKYGQVSFKPAQAKPTKLSPQSSGFEMFEIAQEFWPVGIDESLTRQTITWWQMVAALHSHQIPIRVMPTVSRNSRWALNFSCVQPSLVVPFG